MKIWRLILSSEFGRLCFLLIFLNNHLHNPVQFSIMSSNINGLILITFRCTTCTALQLHRTNFAAWPSRFLKVQRHGQSNASSNVDTWWLCHSHQRTVIQFIQNFASTKKFHSKCRMRLHWHNFLILIWKVCCMAFLLLSLRASFDNEVLMGNYFYISADSLWDSMSQPMETWLRTWTLPMSWSRMEENILALLKIVLERRSIQLDWMSMDFHT